MDIKFKNIYNISIMNPAGDYGDIEICLVDYNTFEEFENELKSHRIKWNKKDGCFSYKGESGALFFTISEKDYGMTADWYHAELENYIQNNLNDGWTEDGESIFVCPGIMLKDAFNQLKSIDGKEIELIAHIKPGDYINEYDGPYMYGKSWNKIKAATKTKDKSKSLSSHIKNSLNSKSDDDEFIDWDDVVSKMK